MPARAYWNGHVRLSLVTFPVHLYSAVTETKKIRLHKISRKSGQRIRYANTTETENRVAPQDIVMGYEYKKGQYVPVDSEELDKLRLESTHMIDLVQFTDISSIDPIYFSKPYFMAPADKIATDAFCTLRDALAAEGKTALGQIVIGGRERIAAIKPCGRGMVLETLRYDYEVREASAYFESIPAKVKVPKEQVDLARQLIESKTAPFDPQDFKDRYQQGLLEIIEAKMKGKKIVAPDAPQRNDNVVDIMDALRKSLARGTAKPAPRKKQSRPRASTRKKTRKAA